MPLEAIRDHFISRCTLSLSPHHSALLIASVFENPLKSWTGLGHISYGSSKWYSNLDVIKIQNKRIYVEIKTEPLSLSISKITVMYILSDSGLKGAIRVFATETEINCALKPNYDEIESPYGSIFVPLSFLEELSPLLPIFRHHTSPTAFEDHGLMLPSLYMISVPSLRDKLNYSTPNSLGLNYLMELTPQLTASAVISLPSTLGLVKLSFFAVPSYEDSDGSIIEDDEKLCKGYRIKISAPLVVPIQLSCSSILDFFRVSGIVESAENIFRNPVSFYDQLLYSARRFTEESQKMHISASSRTIYDLTSFWGQTLNSFYFTEGSLNTEYTYLIDNLSPSQYPKWSFKKLSMSLLPASFMAKIQDISCPLLESNVASPVVPLPARAEHAFSYVSSHVKMTILLDPYDKNWKVTCEKAISSPTLQLHGSPGRKCIERAIINENLIPYLRNPDCSRMRKNILNDKKFDTSAFNPNCFPDLLIRRGEAVSGLTYSSADSVSISNILSTDSPISKLLYKFSSFFYKIQSKSKGSRPFHEGGLKYLVRTNHFYMINPIDGGVAISTDRLFNILTVHVIPVGPSKINLELNCYHPLCAWTGFMNLDSENSISIEFNEFMIESSMFYNALNGYNLPSIKSHVITNPAFIFNNFDDLATIKCTDFVQPSIISDRSLNLINGVFISRSVELSSTGLPLTMSRTSVMSYLSKDNFWQNYLQGMSVSSTFNMNSLLAYKQIFMNKDKYKVLDVNEDNNRERRCNDFFSLSKNPMDPEIALSTKEAEFLAERGGVDDAEVKNLNQFDFLKPTKILPELFLLHSIKAKIKKMRFSLFDKCNAIPQVFDYRPKFEFFTPWNVKIVVEASISDDSLFELLIDSFEKIPIQLLFDKANFASAEQESQVILSITKAFTYIEYIDRIGGTVIGWEKIKILLAPSVSALKEITTNVLSLKVQDQHPSWFKYIDNYFIGNKFCFSPQILILIESLMDGFSAVEALQDSKKPIFDLQSHLSALQKFKFEQLSPSFKKNFWLMNLCGPKIYESYEKNRDINFLPGITTLWLKSPKANDLIEFYSIKMRISNDFKKESIGFLYKLTLLYVNEVSLFLRMFPFMKYGLNAIDSFDNIIKSWSESIAKIYEDIPLVEVDEDEQFKKRIDEAFLYISKLLPDHPMVSNPQKASSHLSYASEMYKSSSLALAQIKNLIQTIFSNYNHVLNFIIKNEGENFFLDIEKRHISFEVLFENIFIYTDKVLNPEESSNEGYTVNDKIKIDFNNIEAIQNSVTSMAEFASKALSTGETDLNPLTDSSKRPLLLYSQCINQYRKAIALVELLQERNLLRSGLNYEFRKTMDAIVTSLRGFRPILLERALVGQISTAAVKISHIKHLNSDYWVDYIYFSCRFYSFDVLFGISNDMDAYTDFFWSFESVLRDFLVNPTKLLSTVGFSSSVKPIHELENIKFPTKDLISSLWRFSDESIWSQTKDMALARLHQQVSAFLSKIDAIIQTETIIVDNEYCLGRHPSDKMYSEMDGMMAERFLIFLWSSLQIKLFTKVQEFLGWTGETHSPDTSFMKALEWCSSNTPFMIHLGQSLTLMGVYAKNLHSYSKISVTTPPDLVFNLPTAVENIGGLNEKKNLLPTIVNSIDKSFDSVISVDERNDFMDLITIRCLLFPRWHVINRSLRVLGRQLNNAWKTEKENSITIPTLSLKEFNIIELPILSDSLQCSSNFDVPTIQNIELKRMDLKDYNRAFCLPYVFWSLPRLIISGLRNLMVCPTTWWNEMYTQKISHANVKIAFYIAEIKDKNILSQTTTDARELRLIELINFVYLELGPLTANVYFQPSLDSHPKLDSSALTSLHKRINYSEKQNNLTIKANLQVAELFNSLINTKFFVHALTPIHNSLLIRNDALYQNLLFEKSAKENIFVKKPLSFCGSGTVKPMNEVNIPFDFINQYIKDITTEMWNVKDFRTMPWNVNNDVWAVSMENAYKSWKSYLTSITGEVLTLLNDFNRVKSDIYDIEIEVNDKIEQFYRRMEFMMFKGQEIAMTTESLQKKRPSEDISVECNILNSVNISFAYEKQQTMKVIKFMDDKLEKTKATLISALGQEHDLIKKRLQLSIAEFDYEYKLLSTIMGSTERVIMAAHEEEEHSISRKRSYEEEQDKTLPPGSIAAICVGVFLFLLLAVIGWRYWIYRGHKAKQKIEFEKAFL